MKLIRCIQSIISIILYYALISTIIYLSVCLLKNYSLAAKCEILLIMLLTNGVVMQAE